MRNDRTRTPRVTGYVGSGWQEMRMSIDGGGPGGMEFIMCVSEMGTTLAIWNPYRHEWADHVLEGHGDTRLGAH